jgi:hypothetical protein
MSLDNVARGTTEDKSKHYKRRYNIRNVQSKGAGLSRNLRSLATKMAHIGVGLMDNQRWRLVYYPQWRRGQTGMPLSSRSFKSSFPLVMSAATMVNVASILG